MEACDVAFIVCVLSETCRVVLFTCDYVRERKYIIFCLHSVCFSLCGPGCNGFQAIWPNAATEERREKRFENISN
jgi:hypothetical protein